MKRILLFSLIILFCSFDRSMDIVSYRQRNFNLQAGVALQGYDPISYIGGRPLEGSEKIDYNYEGVFYYFATKQNRDIFRQNPAAYEPAYGGWCSYNMCNSAKTTPDPKAFKIIGSRLYLFENNVVANAFVKSMEQMRNFADQSWVIFR